MKKTWLAIAVLVMAVSATACSGGNNEATTAAPTTEAATAAPTEETEEESDTEDEDIEEDYMTGVITSIDGDILTVKSDDDDSEKSYDISGADVTREFPFSVGDSVEISYPYETTEDPVPVITLEVLESVIGLNTDPSATGTVTEVTDDSLTLKLNDDETYTVNTANAYVVAANGIKTGDEVTITYIGDLDDEAMAVKVVTKDSYDSAEAELNAFVGEVVQTEEGNIVLESADGDFYTFVSEDLDFSEYSNGDRVQIFYTGTITDKEIPADDIEKK